MDFELELLPEVKADLRDISEWYDKQQIGLGDDFADAFVAMLPTLGRNPAIYARCFRDFRHAMIPRFPYGIYFHIAGQRVLIMRIYHGVRNQAELWKSLRLQSP